MMKAADRLPSRYSEIGDDVATIPTAGRNLVVKTDMLVRKTDMPPGMTLRQAARKAVAMCVSDFASKGVRPDSFLVSLGLPRGLTKRQVAALASGFADACREWKLHLVGGDTGEADDLVIDCAMVGFAEKIVRRNGARPGELVITTGYFGYPPSGLRILAGGAEAKGSFRRRATASVVLPSPKLNVGLSLRNYLRSSMDSSDGLAICLHEIAEMSGVGILLDRLPVGDDVRDFARVNRLSVEELALGGGEEYIIVGTVRKDAFDRARRMAREAGGDLLAVGRVTHDSGVVVMREGDRFKPIERIGWTHLS
jgi:thiamine-monophosphate kinase